MRRVGGGGDDTSYWNISQILLFLCHSSPHTLQTPQKAPPLLTTLYLGSISYPFASGKLRTLNVIHWVISLVHLDQYFVAKCDPKGSTVII